MYATDLTYPTAVYLYIPKNQVFCYARGGIRFLRRTDLNNNTHQNARENQSGKMLAPRVEFFFARKKFLSSFRVR